MNFMNQSLVRGTVHHIESTKTYGQKGFRKRLVVLEETGARFTNYVPVEFVQDSCDSVDDMNIGDEVEIAYRLSGRKWQKDSNAEVKYFVNVEALSFKVLTGAGSSNASAAGSEDANAALNEVEYDENDIPF